MLKQLFSLMVFGGLICMSSVNLMAQEEGAAKSDAPLQVDDVRQLREAAKAINQILGGESLPDEETQATNKVVPKKSTKTPAEVADRALTILSGYVGSAAKTMEKVAPEVWRVMIRQQYAKAFAAPFFDLAAMSLVGIWVLVIKKWWKITDDERRCEGDAYWWWAWMTNIIPFILILILGLSLAYNISTSAQLIINPEYYAFSDLLKLLLNRGMIN